MKKSETISVSDLKNRLLAIVREVEKGKSFAITKGTRLVAKLGPATEEVLPATGFGKVKFRKDAFEPIPVEWSFDAENIGPKR